MSFSWRASASDRRLLPEGRFAGPMPWVIAIMMFLTALAVAAGLGLGEAADGLGRDLAGKLTVQIVEANAKRRDAQARDVMEALDGLAGVQSVDRLDEKEMNALLAPWLGGEGLGGDALPVPALIDVTVSRTGDKDIADIEQAVHEAVPGARVDRHAQWLAPLAGLIGSLQWLSMTLVLMMAMATAAAVVLAARAALNTHRATIDVMHLMGATDVQIARLFQRRIALDALFGGAIGLVLAVIVMLVLGHRLDAIGSELLGSVGLGLRAWALILILPLAGGLLATIAARITVIRTLRKML
ncbi:cell division protein FtsX [Sphingobium boeckii]|uniref:Cell division transport system permease protein n=1 Tax=Sphingobium boeckii TaxID=1082345 RepID=A0A7W9ECN2_9SPHN|nr:cell division protein [Sphingobium boeckii]MBB5684064.1 cell division transport system permease protein [Sphingobium boeckii]